MNPQETQNCLNLLMKKWESGDAQKQNQALNLLLMNINYFELQSGDGLPDKWKSNLNDLKKLQSGASLEDATAVFEQVVRLKNFREGAGNAVLDIETNKVGAGNRTLKCIELIESKKADIAEAVQMLVDMMKDPDFEFNTEKLKANKGNEPKEFQHSLATIIELNPKYLETLSGKSDKDQQEIATKIIQDAVRIHTFINEAGAAVLNIEANKADAAANRTLECIKLINTAQGTDIIKAAQMLVDMVKDSEFELTHAKLNENKINDALKDWVKLLKPTEAVTLQADTDIFAAIKEASTEEALELAKTMILKVKCYKEIVTLGYPPIESIKLFLGEATQKPVMNFIKSSTVQEDDAQELSDIDAMIFDLERNIEFLDESVKTLDDISKGGVEEAQQAKKSRLKILSKKMNFLEDLDADLFRELLVDSKSTENKDQLKTHKDLLVDVLNSVKTYKVKHKDAKDGPTQGSLQAYGDFSLFYKKMQIINKQLGNIAADKKGKAITDVLLPEQPVRMFSTYPYSAKDKRTRQDYALTDVFLAGAINLLILAGSILAAPFQIVMDVRNKVTGDNTNVLSQWFKFVFEQAPFKRGPSYIGVDLLRCAAFCLIPVMVPLELFGGKVIKNLTDLYKSDSIINNFFKDFYRHDKHDNLTIGFALRAVGVALGVAAAIAGLAFPPALPISIAIIAGLVAAEITYRAFPFIHNFIHSSLSMGTKESYERAGRARKGLALAASLVVTLGVFASLTVGLTLAMPVAAIAPVAYAAALMTSATTSYIAGAFALSFMGLGMTLGLPVATLTGLFIADRSKLRNDRIGKNFQDRDAYKASLKKRTLLENLRNFANKRPILGLIVSPILLAASRLSSISNFLTPTQGLDKLYSSADAQTAKRTYMSALIEDREITNIQVYTQKKSFYKRHTLRASEQKDKQEQYVTFKLKDKYYVIATKLYDVSDLKEYSSEKIDIENRIKQDIQYMIKKMQDDPQGKEALFLNENFKKASLGHLKSRGFYIVELDADRRNELEQAGFATSSSPGQRNASSPYEPPRAKGADSLTSGANLERKTSLSPKNT
jgi:hypothetical protein